jgi:hypothetical protein
VRRILAEDGIEPAPERRKHMPWATFLKAHWGTITAIDFFKVEVMTWTGPVRGLGGAFIQQSNDHDADGPLVRRERLGGLLNYCYREAA